MITKKDIPFNMLKAIEGIAQSNLDIIKLSKEDNAYYCFIETDDNSKNYFKIYIDGSKIIANYERKNIAYAWKPANDISSNSYKYQGNLQDVIKQFEVWVKIIRDFYDTPSLHDDNFTKQYAHFYFNEFKIVDKDADTSPFNPDQQDLVELYLDSLTNAIENSNEQVDDIAKSELLSEIKQIKTALSTSTKTKVMIGITNVFGKIYKVSKGFAKEIVVEARKNLIKKLIEFGIEYGPKILEVYTKQS